MLKALDGWAPRVTAICLFLLVILASAVAVTVLRSKTDTEARLERLEKAAAAENDFNKIVLDALKPK